MSRLEWHRGMTYRVARAYRVPPWLIDPEWPRPRYPRVAWLLLRLRWWL